MSRLRAVLVLAALCVGATLRADVVRLSDGRELEGELQDPSLHLTIDGGSSELPKPSLLHAVRSGSAFALLLADGSRVIGSVGEESIQFKVGVLLQTVPMSQVSELMVAPLGFTLGDIRSSYLPADKYKGSAPVVACPLRFEVDPSRYLGVQDRAEVRISGPRFFACEQVSIPTVTMATHKTRKVVEITFRGQISVTESYDRWVRLNVGLFVGQELRARGMVGPVEAEEEKMTGFTVRLSLPRDQFDAMAAGDDPLSIRFHLDIARTRVFEQLQPWASSRASSPQGAKQ